MPKKNSYNTSLSLTMLNPFGGFVVSKPSDVWAGILRIENATQYVNMPFGTAKAYGSSMLILLFPNQMGKTAAEALVIGQQFLNLCMRTGLRAGQIYRKLLWLFHGFCMLFPPKIRVSLKLSHHYIILYSLICNNLEVGESLANGLE